MKKHFNTGNKHAAKSTVKDQYIHIRVDKGTKDKARRDAQDRDLSLSEYIALIINAQ